MTAGPSLHARARRLAILMIGALPVCFLLAVMVGRLAPPAVPVLVIVGYWAFLIYAVVTYPRCPACRTSLYVLYYRRWIMVSGPWARRNCAKCGHDLTTP